MGVYRHQWSMTTRLIVFCITLNIYHCMEHSFNHVQKSGVIGENISWFETKLLNYPAFRYEVNMKFIFKREMCCPIVQLFSNLPDRHDHHPNFFFGSNKCLLNRTIDGMVFWYKSSTFILPNDTVHSEKYSKISALKWTVF